MCDSHREDRRGGRPPPRRGDESKAAGPPPGLGRRLPPVQNGAPIRQAPGPEARMVLPGGFAESFLAEPDEDWPGPYVGGPSAGPARRGFAPVGGRRPERGIGIDVHELMKREAFAPSQPGCDNHFEMNRPCPEGVHGVSDQYVVLDSFVKLRESRVDRGEFRWNFMVQGLTGDEVVGVRDRIDTVTEIQMGSFPLPIPPEVPYVLAAVPLVSPSGTDQLVLVQNNNNAAPPFSPTLVPNTSAILGQYPKESIYPGVGGVAIPWVNNPYTQLPFFGRFTVQIREAGLQSYSDRNGARHHFSFQAVYQAGVDGVNPTMLLATPQNGGRWDTFIFTDPLKDVHGVTLVFRNPDIPIRFLPDCLYDAAVESDGSALPGPFLRIRAPNHGLLAGDRVFIADFKSGNVKLDAYMGRPEGHVAAGDPQAPPAAPGDPLPVDTFYTDPAVGIVDLTVQVPSLPQSATVCVAKRRLLIPVRFRRIVGRLTNYAVPV